MAWLIRMAGLRDLRRDDGVSDVSATVLGDGMSVEMKRFALFGGHHYYPSGGWRDLHGMYDSKSDAKADAKVLFSSRDEWWHIVDLETGKVCK